MPEFGQLVATGVWDAATRTLSDFSAEEIFDLPILDSNYPAVNLTSGAGSGTFGSWTEVVADVGAGKRLICVVFVPRLAATRPWEVEVGEGAAASEAAIARFQGFQSAESAAGMHSTFMPCPWRSVADDARLSVRVRDDSGGALSYQVAVNLA